MKEHRDASNRLTFYFENVEFSEYSKLSEQVVRKFRLEPASHLVNGLDEYFQDFKSGNLVVGLEWDIWSGYIVNSKNIESESLAREIAGHISTICQST